MWHRGLAAASAIWAAIGLSIALAGFGSVNEDARLLVFSATVVGVGSAVLASGLLLRGRRRWAGVCLIVSVITPTWFAAWLNLVPLIAGLILLSGRVSDPNHGGRSPSHVR